jgi:two-component system chemotaxis sensor kinase CheA
LIDGDQVELLDLHWLFAAHAGDHGQAAEPPVCLLPAGDPWMDNILRPIVESAGYRVLRPGEPGADAAQIVIVSEGQAPPAAAENARVLRLRSEIAPSGKKDDSIHRYDRAALLGALGARARGKG